MKRGALVLTVIAGLAVFLVVLVLYLPASWFASALPPQVHCGELGGSVWHGECLGLTLAGRALGDATWNLGTRQRAHAAGWPETSICAAPRSICAQTWTRASAASASCAT